MFKAMMLTQGPNRTTEARLADLNDSDLPTHPVSVRVDYSSLNFKDALAVTGRSPIVKQWPMVPGIDLVGTVTHSDDPAWKVGDAVVVNGWGLGETDWGGLAQQARLKPQWLLKLPAPFTARQAAAIGTAGYTAALCVLALQKHGLTPAAGPVLVTGASGGVGSVAIVLLAGLGFEVHAATGRPAEADYLRSLGATQIVDRTTLSQPGGKPLAAERWAGVVDTVGSHTLANACAATKWNGAIAACGLAQGADFPATVMPFILRGVTLYGINCVFEPNAKRSQAWDLLARHLPAATLDAMTHEVALSQAVAASNDLLDSKLHGRTVVDVNR